ncbi:MAG: hypothetical protein JSV97_08150 [candidate division WOR-3 bacterium]|nr:MAG: hypothetical protein JSV97_08150 [candidate division WOR-3 bacterium]
MFRWLVVFLTLCSGTLAQCIDVLDDSTAIHEAYYRRESVMQSVQDVWFSQDKFLHFSVSAALPGLTYYLYASRLKGDEELGKVYSISITALFGIGKEIYDKKKKGYFSWKDLFWNGVGLAVGYLIFVHEF